MAQVSANKSAAKCWSVINGDVYDLTKWISAHPGGAGAILSLCGTDGTKDFLAMHRNQSKPEARLDSYLLGPLAK
jgi:cytochrome b involved in lipid metabolism